MNTPVLLFSVGCASLPVQRAFLPSYVPFIYPSVRPCVRISVRSWYVEYSIRSHLLAGRTRVVVARVGERLARG